jgi:hypothetical protein
VLLSGGSGIAAERQEWRHRRGIWRHGQPDGIRAAGRGHSAVEGDDLVSGHLHADLDYSVDFCGTAQRNAGLGFGIVGREELADELTTGSSREGAGESGIAAGTCEVEFLSFTASLTGALPKVVIRNVVLRDVGPS